MEEVRLKMFEHAKGVLKKRSYLLFQLIFCLLLVIFSGFGILNLFGIELIFPYFMFSKYFIEFLLIVLGVVFIVDFFKNKDLPEKYLRFVLGIFVLLFGALPLFHSIGMFSFLPIIIYLKVSGVVLIVLLFVASLYFLIDRIVLLFF